ncbi:response regulator transcription factor [Actinophytocola sp.]|uniref:helix-turn-helix transcriptional regulator n=1 Tax=Actinophytocola sp. TaxID=1872138 RepID=UPI003D6BE976
MIRFGIAALLDLDPGVVLVGHGDGSWAPSMGDGWSSVDVLVAPSVAAAAAALRGGGVPILVVSSSSLRANGYVDARAGVYGCVAADVSGDDLSAAVRAVAAREPFLPVAAGLGVEPAPLAKLSPRERQAVILIAQGFTHYQVARRMGIAQSTLETYVKRVRGKLGLGNKAELTVVALGAQDSFGPPQQVANPLVRNENPATLPVA